MTSSWRIRISGQRRRKPNVDLLVQAVLALAEQLQAEVEESKPSPEIPPAEPEQVTP